MADEVDGTDANDTTTSRPGLVWALPVVVAVVVMVGLALDTGSDGPSAAAPASTPSTTGSSGDSSREPAPSASTTPSTPTTAFYQRVPSLPDEPYDYRTALPEHLVTSALDGPLHPPLPEIDTAVGDAAVTDAGATLGRVLFYDVNLSANRTVRCASCHVQANSFTDPLTLSQGFTGARTRRNSMPLANARFTASGRFLWDEAAATLEEQVLMPFVDVTEMGITEEILIDRIEEQDYYEPLFTDAFGDDAVELDRVASALAQFIRAMVSVDSRYDEGRRLVDSPLEAFPNFSAAENRGKELFYTPVARGGGSCSGCHTTEAQINTPAGLNNNGLDPPTSILIPPDLGAFEVTGDVGDVGRFRVPSLRNVEVTGPYMHDGRLSSLEAVIDHYDSGVQPHENLSPRLRSRNGEPVRMGFSDDDKAALVAFLRTLTDDSFLTDPRFSEPFRGS